MKMIPAHAPPHNTHKLVKFLAIIVRKRERVKEILENKVKNLLQTDKYLTVSSGRRALYIGLKSLGMGKEDEVILPAFTEPLIPDHGYPISENLYTSRFQDGIPNAKILSKTLIGIPVHVKIAEDKLVKVFGDKMDEN